MSFRQFASHMLTSWLGTQPHEPRRCLRIEEGLHHFLSSFDNMRASYTLSSDSSFLRWPRTFLSNFSSLWTVCFHNFAEFWLLLRKLSTSYLRLTFQLFNILFGKNTSFFSFSFTSLRFAPEQNKVWFSFSLLCWKKTRFPSRSLIQKSLFHPALSKT